MLRRRKALLLLALGLFVCGLVVGLTRDKEPSYDGRSLSEWAEIYATSRRRNSIDPPPEPADAIRHIGTNALPWLLAWSDYEPPRWKKTLLAASRKLPQSLAQSPQVIRLLSSEDSDKCADQATAAFTALGPIAAPAVPELTRRIHLANMTRKYRAMLALASIGPAGLPAMTDLVSKFDQENTFLVTACIRKMGTNARPLVPLLVPYLQSTNWVAAMNAATALGDLKSDPELVVPALIKGLDNPRNEVRIEMLLAVRQFGELARPSLPALSNALSDPNPTVRNLASNAIWRIPKRANPPVINAPVINARPR